MKKMATHPGRDNSIQAYKIVAPTSLPCFDTKFCRLFTRNTFLRRTEIINLLA
jgi:hypothetical protein